MTGISRLLLRGKFFTLGSFHFNMTRPPPSRRHSILHLLVDHSSASKNSAEHHIIEKCVTCNSEHLKTMSTVLGNLPQGWVYESYLSPQGANSSSMRSHIKVPILHFFFPLTFSYGWKQMTGKLHPCLTNGRVAILHRLPSGKLLPLKERMWTNRLPLLQLLNTLISQRDCSHLHRRVMERHLCVTTWCWGQG